VHRVQVRTIAEDTTLPRIVRRSGGSSLTRRPAQMVPLSAQGRDAVTIAEVASTGRDRVRDVLRDVNANGFDSLQPTCRCGPAAQVHAHAVGPARAPTPPDRPGATTGVPELRVRARPLRSRAHPAARGGGGPPPGGHRARWAAHRLAVAPSQSGWAAERAPVIPSPAVPRTPSAGRRPDPSMTHFTGRRRDDRGVGGMHHRRSRAVRWWVAPAGELRAGSHVHTA